MRKGATAKDGAAADAEDEDSDEGCTVEEIKDEEVPSSNEATAASVQEPAKDQMHQLADMITGLKAEQEP